MFKECPLQIIYCTQDCGTIVRQDGLKEHIKNHCRNTRVSCDQCGLGKENVNLQFKRHKLQDHLFLDCEGFTRCKECYGHYKEGINIPSRDFDHKCSDYVLRLMEEIVGPKAFKMARDTLNFKLTERKVL